MKRILAFLLIFGSGLGLLLYLQAGAGPGQDPDGLEPSAPGTPGDAASELITVPDEVVVPGAPPAAGDAGASGSTDDTGPAGEPPLERIDTQAGGVRGSISGPIEHTRFAEDDADRSSAIFRLTTRDSFTAEDGRLELIEVVLDHFERGRVAAASGRVVAKLNQTGVLTLGGGDDGIELDTARIDLDSDHALAPLALTGGKLTGKLEGQRFDLTADAEGVGAPHLESARFGLDAARLSVFFETGALAASGAARLVLSAEGDAPERSLTAEQLSIVEDEAGRVVLDARGAGDVLAVLTLGGATPDEDLVLRAPQLLLVARRVGDKDLLLESLVVSGSGQVERAGGIARGEDLDFLFSEDGEAGRVILSGSPSLTFPGLVSASLSELPSDLVLEAEGPLTLALDGDLEFRTDAASRVTWGQLTLDSRGGLEGEALEGATHLGLRGRGGVSLFGTLPTPEKLVAEGASSQGELTYTTETVDLDYRVPVDPVTGKRVPKGAVRVQLIGTGATSILAVDPEGHRANVTCGDGLTLLIEGERWTAPQGRDVELSLEVEGGSYVGHADELLGLDPTALRLDARGGAFLERRGQPPLEHRSGQGARIVLDGEDQLRIVGSDQARARYEEGESFVEAARFERQGGRLTATGEVVTHLELADLVLDFRCGSLEVRGLDPEAGTADKLELRRGVDGEVTLGTEVLRLAARGLDVLRLGEAVPLPDGVVAPARYELHAMGPVALGWSNAGADWKVDCEQLDVFAEEPPAGALGAFELVAKGKVRVRDEVAGFVGLGEVLHLDHAAVDRALLEGGELPARVSGTLPAMSGSKIQYKGRVARLALVGRKLEAEDVDLLLTGLRLPGSEGPERSDWTARCKLLRAEVGSVELDGKVSFQGRDAGALVLFSADRAVFVNSELLGSKQENVELDPATAAGTSFAANGNVLLRRGTEYQVEGQELTIAANTRELRVGGDNARISYAGICLNGRWLRLDPIQMTVDSSPGVITVDPVLLRILGRTPNALEATPEVLEELP
ncbi:MAG: hypothetical protein P1V81_10575 [Planctomycetota bacterium]|nr:hypothetical protein [Planctomycetota bacterium]